jgi:hypothetical protein
VTFLLTVVALPRGKTLLHQSKKLNLGKIGELSGHSLRIRNILGRKPTVAVVHLTVKLLSLVTDVVVQEPLLGKVGGCCQLILESDLGQCHVKLSL